MVHRRYGPAEVMELADIPEPHVGPGDVLIGVRAAGVNPVDVKMRAGSHRFVVPRTLPWVLGLDVSGIVEAVGPDVSKWATGDEVMSSPGHHRYGCYAERVVIAADEVAPKPVSWSHEEAASLPLVGLTAWQCLARFVTPGDRVFVQAGSGGVGTAGIQLAHHLGAWVATTCSARNHELVRALGADAVIDYQHADHGTVLGDLDVALESLIGRARRQTLRAMRRGGRISFVSTGLPTFVGRAGPVLGTVWSAVDTLRFVTESALRGVRSVPVVRTPDGEALRTLSELADQGVLRPVVERVYDMVEVQAAHRHVETGRTRGKVVLRGFSA